MESKSSEESERPVTPEPSCDSCGKAPVWQHFIHVSTGHFCARAPACVLKAFIFFSLSEVNTMYPMHGSFKGERECSDHSLAQFVSDVATRWQLICKVVCYVTPQRTGSFLSGSQFQKRDVLLARND